MTAKNQMTAIKQLAALSNSSERPDEITRPSLETIISLGFCLNNFFGD
jgi:hypothetical protein